MPTSPKPGAATPNRVGPWRDGPRRILSPAARRNQPAPPPARPLLPTMRLSERARPASRISSGTRRGSIAAPRRRRRSCSSCCWARPWRAPAQAVWALREEGRARKAEQEAVEKEQEGPGRGRRGSRASSISRRRRGRPRSRSCRHAQVGGARTARRSEEATKAILDFFKKTLLSAGRPGVTGRWRRPSGPAARASDVTLRKAVDATESQVAGAFADRPLGEAIGPRDAGPGLSERGRTGPGGPAVRTRVGLAGGHARGQPPRQRPHCRNQLAVAYRLAGRDRRGRPPVRPRTPIPPSHASALAVARIDAASREESPPRPS